MHGPKKKHTHIACSINIFLKKSCRFWSNAEEFGRAGHATDGNIVQRMNFACWIPKTTNTYSEYVILTAFFHCNNGYANLPQCYVIRSLPLLFFCLVPVLGSHYRV